jgi:oxygen-independent coproporphyrinogen III oxidase
MIARRDASNRYEVDRDVFNRYAGLSLPRHVSYPMPTWWEDMSSDDATKMRAASDAHETECDLSLYLHIPFCEKLCKFCACNKIIMGTDRTSVREQIERYLAAIEKEIRQLAASIDTTRPLRQIHWGGGSPTYLLPHEMERIQSTIEDVFDIADEAEIAMEIDPRTTTEAKLKTLRQLGFNRLSMGVQDFDHSVQKHVRRVQPFEMVRDLVDTIRTLGFPSVNFDLIYGMPYQTPDTIRQTVEKAISLAPDRVAYYHYAQIPEKIATQRGMDYTRLPDSETKLDMFLIGLNLFEQAGYEFIGLDHFAKSDERLSESLRDGTVQRNFQGMTTGGDLRLYGVGVSSISHLTEVGFLQNVKDVDRYMQLVEEGHSPIDRGKWFTPDDIIRQAVLGELYCLAELDPKRIEDGFDLSFDETFARELGILATFEKDGLITIELDGTIRVTKPLGRVLLRNIAAVFDAYLGSEAYRKGELATFSVNA